MSVRHYRELAVWQKSMDLAEKCYGATSRFPRDELFGMVSQIRRAACAVPANIAEGHGRQHTREFVHFVSIARGSLMELETHLMLSQRVGLLRQECLDALLAETGEVSRMLSDLRKGLQKRLE